MDIISMGVAANGLAIATEAAQRVKELTPSYISISSESGVLDDATFNELIENNLNELVYGGCYFQLAYKDETTRRYATNVLRDNSLQLIELTLATKAYQYSTIPLDSGEALDEHIHNTDVHIQEGERNAWNNKVSCSRSDEVLVFTIN